MFLRTESDFIVASNMAYDLAGVVTTYLDLFREYINGYNGINIPSYEYAVTFKPSKKEHFIQAVLHWTDQRVHTETLYYDSDSDYFSEQWGADNSCGESSYTEEYARSKHIDIPIQNLMMNAGQMLTYFKDKKVMWEAEKKEVIRLEEIRRLKAELERLEK
jgi:hypothetical protein